MSVGNLPLRTRRDRTPSGASTVREDSLVPQPAFPITHPVLHAKRSSTTAPRVDIAEPSGPHRGGSSGGQHDDELAAPFSFPSVSSNPGMRKALCRVEDPEHGLTVVAPGRRVRRDHHRADSNQQSDGNPLAHSLSMTKTRHPSIPSGANGEHSPSRVSRVSDANPTAPSAPVRLPFTQHMGRKLAPESMPHLSHRRP
jgi:hypothetical protein